MMMKMNLLHTQAGRKETAAAAVDPSAVAATPLSPSAILAGRMRVGLCARRSSR